VPRRQAGIRIEDIDEVIMGNVLRCRLGQNPARQAMLLAGLPVEVAAVTVNKVCGSGLQAVIFASQAIASGDAAVVVAGGMENMYQAHYYSPQARGGYRLWNCQMAVLTLPFGCCLFWMKGVAAFQSREKEGDVIQGQQENYHGGIKNKRAEY